MEMRHPDFLVVGAARAGTTTLYSYLRQHPGIFLPTVKEPCFFAFAGEENKYVQGKFAFAVRTREEYEKLFNKAGPDQKTGEMSTPYLYLHEQTIGNLKKFVPQFEKIKIVIMLRNPADRAYSQYLWRVRDGREPLTFEDAVESERHRMQNGYSFDYYYIDRGFYFRQVKDFLDHFENVHIILFEDFIKNPQMMLKQLCGFLGVDPSFHFRPEEIVNESYMPKWKGLSRFVTTESRLKFKVWHSMPHPLRKRIRRFLLYVNKDRATRESAMDSSLRIKILEGYREDILSLQEVIKRDLSGWLK